MKRILTVILPAIALSGCFEGCATDTTGFSKEQRVAARVEDNKRRTAWTLFGLNLLTSVVEASTNSQRGDGFRK